MRKKYDVGNVRGNKHIISVNVLKCFSVCRCQGYVYTYRLQKDVSGSWAADVRHFILLPFITSLGFIRLKKQLHMCSSYPGSFFLLKS